MALNRLDMAVLVVDCVGLKPLQMADSPARSGEPVIAVGGRRFDEPIGRRSGAVTSVAASLQNNLDPTRRRDYNRLIESTATLEPGFSGGPLLDLHGRLVGLNVAMTGRPGSAQCRGYAIPFDDAARQAINGLMGQVGEPER
jgi:S1-C subfamily serine protease